LRLNKPRNARSGRRSKAFYSLSFQERVRER